MCSSGHSAFKKGLRILRVTAGAASPPPGCFAHVTEDVKHLESHCVTQRLLTLPGLLDWPCQRTLSQCTQAGRAGTTSSFPTLQLPAAPPAESSCSLVWICTSTGPGLRHPEAAGKCWPALPCLPWWPHADPVPVQPRTSCTASPPLGCSAHAYHKPCLQTLPVQAKDC